MANEKRLTDANALSEEISSLSMFMTGIRFGQGVLSEYIKEYRKSVLKIVDEAPTVDAVEVVRCKDCKYWDEDRRCNGRKNGLVMEYTWDDDFCSYGERREGEKNAE